jgi:hypothetical protein
MKSRWLLCGALAALSLAVPVRAADDPGAWLDAKTVANWNDPGAAIPKPHKDAGAVGNDERCASNLRRATSPEDRLVAAAGWKLVGPYMRFDGTSIVRGAAGFDGMCRWWGYQAFVFVDGAFAGTLAPHAMDSRADGALGNVYLYAPNDIEVEYSRYASSDPLCCPSRTTSVGFAVTRKAEHGVVIVKNSFTENNPKQ